MFKQIYQSDPIQYFEERFMEPGFGPQFAQTIPSDPSPWGESIRGIQGFFVYREKTAASDVTIKVLTSNYIRNFPWTVFRLYSLDPVSGKFLNDPITNSPKVGFNNNVLGNGMVNEADGTPRIAWIAPLVWRIYDMVKKEVDFLSPAIDGEFYDPVYKIMETFLADRQENRFVRPLRGTAQAPAIEVFNLTTAELLKTINISGIPKQIFPENERHLYVYCKNGMMNLVDYIQGKVISTFRAPYDINSSPLFFADTFQTFAYDRFYRRLLSITLTPDDPITKQCTVAVKGWYPVPVAVRIMKPIPLVAPRANRTVPYLTKIFGDVGEPISGANIAAVASGVSTVINAPSITNNNGEALIQATSTTNGAATITVTTEVN